MKKLGAFVMSIVVAGMLNGCFDSTPSCDDKVITQHLNDVLTELYKNIATSSLSEYKTERVDDNAKKVTCQAKISITAFGQTNTDILRYTAQNTGKDIEVEILDN